MSYDTMDHAGWVERNIAAVRCGRMSAIDRRRRAQGRGWWAAPEKLNPFQCRVMTILGIVGGGIYNAPIEWESVHWASWFVFVNWSSSLSTVDYRGLTDAVLLAHDAGIRLEIAPAMRWLRLGFHDRERQTPEMGISQGHPSLETAIERHRKRFPTGHHIHLENWTPQLVPAAAGAIG